MRISDWISDGCSSDLMAAQALLTGLGRRRMPFCRLFKNMMVRTRYALEQSANMHAGLQEAAPQRAAGACGEQYDQNALCAYGQGRSGGPDTHNRYSGFADSAASGMG